MKNRKKMFKASAGILSATIMGAAVASPILMTSCGVIRDFIKINQGTSGKGVVSFGETGTHYVPSINGLSASGSINGDSNVEIEWSNATDIAYAGALVIPTTKGSSISPYINLSNDNIKDPGTYTFKIIAKCTQNENLSSTYTYTLTRQQSNNEVTGISITGNGNISSEVDYNSNEGKLFLNPEDNNVVSATVQGKADFNRNVTWNNTTQGDYKDALVLDLQQSENNNVIKPYIDLSNSNISGSGLYIFTLTAVADGNINVFANYTYTLTRKEEPKIKGVKINGNEKTEDKQTVSYATNDPIYYLITEENLNHQMTAAVEIQGEISNEVNWYNETEDDYKDALSWETDSTNPNIITPYIDLSNSSIANADKYTFIIKAEAKDDIEKFATYTYILTRSEEPTVTNITLGTTIDENNSINYNDRKGDQIIGQITPTVKADDGVTNTKVDWSYTTKNEGCEDVITLPSDPTASGSAIIPIFNFADTDMQKVDTYEFIITATSNLNKNISSSIKIKIIRTASAVDGIVLENEERIPTESTVGADNLNQKYNLEPLTANATSSSKPEENFDNSVKWTNETDANIKRAIAMGTQDGNTITPYINLNDELLQNPGEYDFILKATSIDNPDIFYTFKYKLIRSSIIVSETSYITFSEGPGKSETINLPFTTANVNALQSRDTDDNFTYNFDTTGDGNPDKQISSTSITAICFGKQWLGATELGDNFCSKMFFKRNDLTEINVDFQGLNNIKKVGDNFATSMFYGCPNIEKMNENFNFPENIEISGHNFAVQMFAFEDNGTGTETNKLEMNNIFNFPQKMQQTGIGFASGMFAGRSNLKMNDIFNLPEALTQAGDSFASYMFWKTYNLEINNKFKFPANINSVEYFALSIFASSKNIYSLSSIQIQIYFPFEAYAALENVEEDEYYSPTTLDNYRTVPKETTITFLKIKI